MIAEKPFQSLLLPNKFGYLRLCIVIEFNLVNRLKNMQISIGVNLNYFPAQFNGTFSWKPQNKINRTLVPAA